MHTRIAEQLWRPDQASKDEVPPGLHNTRTREVAGETGRHLGGLIQDRHPGGRGWDSTGAW
ncbi:hypothetical protein HMPREF3172_09855 [Brevibacterium sp. HMSC08F02]|nr:hypothetical protein HMPREF3172_09855 [Brevibacterium sp. HMSC08F02]